MNPATLSSIHSGFQTVNNTLMSAQEIPVIGIFASVAQFFVSTAELITAAAVAPINRDRSINPQFVEDLISDQLDKSYNVQKHKLAVDGLDGVITSVINVATLGFFVPIVRYFVTEDTEELHTFSPDELVPPHMLNPQKNESIDENK